jgi:predicted dehydrogenase
MSISRRKFLEESLLAAAASVAASCASRGTTSTATAPVPAPTGANDRIRVAIIGVNGRGMAHVRGFAKKPGVEIATICDLDEAAAAKAIKETLDKSPPGTKAPRFERDLRRVMEDKEIDVISVATPNHWHSLMAVWGIQAGKDVYLEKPVSHNVHEGRIVVDLARKHGRIVQCGSQSRSNPGMQKFIEYVRSGKLGQVKLARGLCYKRRESIGKVAAALPPPPGIDYDLWLGPAPARKDVPREKFHYDWHWQWDYGNGDIGNQGAHEIDKARWVLGKQVMPNSVTCIGGRFGYEDDGQTANTQLAYFDYGDVQLVFEVRGLPTQDLQGAKVGNIFYGSEGYAVSTSYSSGTIFDLKGEKVAHFEGGADHFANFLAAVRSRKPTDLSCDIEEGHLSASLCHLANISYRLGTPQPLGKKPSALAPFTDAEEAFARFEKHLSDNGVSPAKTNLLLGRTLSLSPGKEAFSNAGRDADGLLSRDYRPGFVVPAHV